MKNYKYECSVCRSVVFLRLEPDNIPLENPPCHCGKSTMTGVEVENE